MLVASRTESGAFLVVGPVAAVEVDPIREVGQTHELPSAAAHISPVDCPIVGRACVHGQLTAKGVEALVDAWQVADRDDAVLYAAIEREYAHVLTASLTGGTK